MSSSPSFLDFTILPLIRGDSVLDIGCGYGRWGNLIRSNYWEAGLQAPPPVDGVDAFAPNVELCQQLPSYRKVWHANLVEDRLEGSWDTVLACEIVEHIPQDHVERLIADLERVARKRVIISTPNFPDFRGGLDSIVGFNDFEAHVSHLPRRWFRERGYRAWAVGIGQRNNFPSRVINKLLPSARLALVGLPRWLPFFGTQLVAYKDFDG
jgi:2-polyprenyl-3-methyl-5-hydroxy-6-metoxy-1,4-benzoquinol methylase